MKVARILACLFLFAGMVSVTTAQSLVTVYAEDFDGVSFYDHGTTTDGISWSWSKHPIDTTPNHIRTFLGEFGGEPVTLDLWNLPEHCSVTISFDLLIINHWEGSVGFNAGPDIWDLEAFSRDNCCPVRNLLHTTFANCACKYQAYPDGYPDVHHPGWTRADEVNTLGYEVDSVYYLSFSFFHDMDDVTFRFAATPNLQSILDESWGIDNVVVEMDTEGIHCCRATRELPIAYGRGAEVPVSIDVNLNPRAQTHVIEESPPSGWAISQINEGGIYVSSDHTIKWGPFYGTAPRTLSYLATPPNNASGTYTFAGDMVVDGTSEAICGDNAIDRGSYHPADLDSNYYIVATEFTAYGAAWRKGDLWSREPNPIPADYVTNAGWIWKNGERYRYSPGDAPPWLVRSKGYGEGSGTVTADISVNGYEAGSPMKVSITAVPAAGTSAYAIEEKPPAGWVVADISDSGSHDNTNGVIKWGVFSDDQSRTVSYTLIPALTVSGTYAFNGLGSFDGTSYPTTGHRNLGPSTFSGHSFLVPASAHAPGRAGTSWRTDLGVHNRGTTQATYTVALLKDGMDNTNKETITFTLNPGMSIRYDDAVGELFDFTGSAALLITSSSEDMIITSRTYTQAEDGTFGQSIPGKAIDEALTTGMEARLVGLSQSTDRKQGFRTNIGFASVSEVPITVNLDFYNREGTFLDTLTVELQPFEFRQESGLFSQIADRDFDDAYVIVRSDSEGARYFAYASLIDNKTNDSVFRPAE